MFKAENCVGCMACIPACPQKAIGPDGNGKVKTDRYQCTNCFDCVRECYFNARSATGKPYTSETLYKELMKDEVVFKTSGGGITFSGGEPMAHTDFLNVLLPKFKSAHVNTAMETCGYTTWESFESLKDKVDLFLYDIKAFDSDLHAQWTGAPNELIMENAKRLACSGAKMIIRVPLIPGVNDTQAEFAKIAQFAAGLPGVHELHILPFHQIGSSKYTMVDKDYALADWEEESIEKADECKKIAEAAGLRVSIGGTGFASERMNKQSF